MKKFLLVSIALFSIIATSFAQSRGYEMNVRTGVAPDLKFSDIDLSTMFTNGYRFNRHVFLGGGAGLKLKLMGDDYVRMLQNSDYTVLYPSIAVFLNAKFNLTKTRVSPYFSIDSGYVANLELEEESDMDSSGLFVMPAIGFDCNIGAKKKHAVFVQTGFYIQDHPELLTWESEDGPYMKIELSVGFRF